MLWKYQEGVLKLTYHSIAWIILPGYMIYVFGKEILEGLEIATQTKRSR